MYLLAAIGIASSFAYPVNSLAGDFKININTKDEKNHKDDAEEKKDKEDEKDSSDIKISFNEPWKYFVGDSALFSNTGFDDQSWHELKKGEEVDLSADSLLKSVYGIIWFRTPIDVDSSVVGIPLGLFLRQKGSAAEFYLDGKLMERFGKVGRDRKSEEARFNSNPKPFPMVFSKSGKHFLAIRFSSFHSVFGKHTNEDRGFSIEFSDLENNLYNLLDRNVNFPLISLFAIYLTLGVVHIIMFSYFRAYKHNLYFGLFCTGISFFLFSMYYSVSETNFEVYNFLTESNFYTAPLLVLSLIALYHTIYYKRLLKIFWVICAIYIVFLISKALDYELYKVSIGFFIGISIIEIFRVHIRSIIKRRDGAWILGMGVLYFPLSIVLIMIYGIFINDSLNDYDKQFGIIMAKTLGYSLSLSIPFSITLYLSRNFARVNKKLLIQVEEIKSLSEKTLAHEIEKKEILEEQNFLLETKVIERTRELGDKNELIQIKNKEITDNLNYAKKIQTALLPDPELMKAAFNGGFVLYRPKDIVSGDFYAYFQKGTKYFIAAVDCTGHGVSGAFMSMIGSTALNQIVNNKNVTKPSEILDLLDVEIISTLNQKSGGSNDGMDIALISIDKSNNQLEFSGANRPLWIVRDKLISSLVPNKFPIGGFQNQRQTAFTNQVVNLEVGDCIYLFSDGMADQFGGEKGKKLMTKKLREIFIEINEKPMNIQEEYLNNFLNQWQGLNEQLDDILVIGIRI